MLAAADRSRSAPDRRRTRLHNRQALLRLLQQALAHRSQFGLDRFEHLDVVDGHELVGQLQDGQSHVVVLADEFLAEEAVAPGPDVDQRQARGRRTHVIAGRLQAGIELDGVRGFGREPRPSRLASGPAERGCGKFPPAAAGAAVRAPCRRPPAHPSSPPVWCPAPTRLEVLRSACCSVASRRSRASSACRGSSGTAQRDSASANRCGLGQARGTEDIFHPPHEVVTDLHVVVGHRRPLAGDGQHDLALAALPGKRLGHPLLPDRRSAAPAANRRSRRR